MKRDVIDGVTVVWRELPGPLTAKLSFGCGHRDEEFDLIGLTHFVQQLASPTPDQNGLVSHLTTEFEVSGPPDRIVADLAAVCSALTAPPDPDRMAEVAGETDSRDRFSPLSFDSDLRYPFASLLSRRFGPRGPGLARWPAVEYSLFTPEQVQAHIGRYFVASNAVLTLTGPPPDGLRLPLPQGPKPVREALPVKSTPLWYRDEAVGAAISFRVEAGQLPLYYLVAALVLDQIGDSARAISDAILLDSSCHEAGFTLTPKGNGAAEAAVQTWGQLRRLASHGPTRAEIVAAMSAWERAIAESEIAMAKLLPDAVRETGQFEPEIEQELFGARESLSDADRAQLAQTAPDQVRWAVADWLRSAMIVVPRGTSPALEGVAESSCPMSGHTPMGDVFKPSLLKRLRGGGGQIVVNSSGVSIVDQQGTHYSGIGDLVVIQGDREVWVGDPGHGCLHDISAFGSAADRIWQSASATRRRIGFR